MIINIIGAGKLGATLGYLFSKVSSVKIGAIYNTSSKSSEKAIKFIGQGTYYSDIALIPPADLTLISTPDDKNF